MAEPVPKGIAPIENQCGEAVDVVVIDVDENRQREPEQSLGAHAFEA